MATFALILKRRGSSSLTITGFIPPPLWIPRPHMSLCRTTQKIRSGDCICYTLSQITIAPLHVENTVNSFMPRMLINLWEFWCLTLRFCKPKFPASEALFSYPFHVLFSSSTTTSEFVWFLGWFLAREWNEPHFRRVINDICLYKQNAWIFTEWLRRLWVDVRPPYSV